MTNNNHQRAKDIADYAVQAYKNVSCDDALNIQDMALTMLMDGRIKIDTPIAISTDMVIQALEDAE